MIRKLLLPLLFSAAFITTAPASAALGPMQRVQNTIDTILAVLKDDSLDRDSRRAKIIDRINTSFDFRAMSQSTLATNWKKASDAQKNAFVERFSQLIQSSYMGRLEAYTDEKVEYVKEKIKSNGKKAVIDTLIVTKSVDIPINYKLLRRGDEWRVYDVVIEKVSLVSSYRSSYKSLIDKQGFDGLLVAMDEKIAELNATVAEASQTAAAPARP